VALAPAGAASARTLFVRNYINSNDVRGVVEWGGTLALATRGGVVLHDPVDGSFRKILAAPAGLTSNDVTCLAVGPSGTLWAGTQDRGVARLKPGGGFRRALSTFDGLPSDAVRALYVHGDSIWVGTGGGVALFTENAATGQVALRRVDTRASTAGGLAEDAVDGLAQLGDTLWCASGGRLSSFARGVWVPRGTVGSAARAVAVHQDTLWVGSSAGPWRYAAGAFQLVGGGHTGESLQLESTPDGLLSSEIAEGAHRYAGGAWAPLGAADRALTVGARDFLSTPGGVIWAATRAGLARLEPAGDAWAARLSAGPLVDAFLPPSVRATADARGVWFTAGNGSAVVHYDGTAWTTLTSASTGGQLEAGGVFGLLSDRRGRLWFGHCCIASLPLPRLDRFDPATGAWDRPAAWNILSLAEAPSGRVYAAGVEYGNGIYEFDGATGALLDSLTPANTQGGTGPGLTSNIIRSIAFDAEGKGWIALINFGLDVWDGRGTATRSDDLWTHVAGLPSPLSFCLAVESPSRGWLGTIAGLARVDNGAVTQTWTPFTSPALPAAQVNDLALDSDGNLWIATSAGLALLDREGSLQVFTTRDGLVDDRVSCLAWDPAQGAIWAGTARGISRVVAGGGAAPGFSGRTFVYPNPLREGGGRLRLGGLTDAIEGEIRDPAGRVVRRFRADPSSEEIWDLRRADGGPAAPGIYLVVLRDGDATRILRVALLR
jgi:ligand-binding sensor domain-containing protein